MKLKITLSILSIFLFTLIKAQVPCWFDSLRFKNFTQDSNAKQQENLFYYRLNNWRTQNTLKLEPNITPYSDPLGLTINSGCFKAKYIIPVVVHVVHHPSHSLNNQSNIRVSQIQNQIHYLNRYFANMQAGSAPFVNTGIQFCLAPVGSNNDGIIRYSDSLSNHNPNDMDALMDLKSPDLPYNEYLHIYVVNDIVDGGGTSSGIQGYATFPGTEPQGIVIKHNRFGNSNDCSPCTLETGTEGKILAHEVGHFLGLKHPFEGGCVGELASNCASQGDYICDTPPMTQGSSSCATTTNTCYEHPTDRNDPINKCLPNRIQKHCNL
jgi:hypothetical protein